MVSIHHLVTAIDYYHYGIVYFSHEYINGYNRINNERTNEQRDGDDDQEDDKRNKVETYFKTVRLIFFSL